MKDLTHLFEAPEETDPYQVDPVDYLSIGDLVIIVDETQPLLGEGGCRLRLTRSLA